MDIYERLNRIIACISDSAFDGSLETLSIRTEVPSSQLKNDLDFLMENEYTKTLFNTSDSSLNKISVNPFIDILDVLVHESGIDRRTLPKKIVDLIKRFRTDTAKLCPVDNFEARQHIFLDPRTYDSNGGNTTAEHQELIKYLGYNSGKTGQYFFIKSTLYSNISYDSDTAKALNQCIKIGKVIPLKSGDFVPHFIKMDMNTRNIFVVEAYRNQFAISAKAFALNQFNKFDFDDFKDYPIDDVRAKIKKDDAVIKYINSLWSFYPEYLTDTSEQTPTHVKIHIYDGTKNIIDKLKKDLAYREYATLKGPYPCPDYIDDGNGPDEFYVYEDDIIGIQAFKRWLYQYGRSMIVMEPKELAYEIYNELGVDI